MAQTASELSDKMNRINKIAHEDFIETLSAIMPYLRERRQVAKILTEKNSTLGYEYLQEFNKNIKEILNLF